jgi:hypothetical protein
MMWCGGSHTSLSGCWLESKPVKGSICFWFAQFPSPILSEICDRIQAACDGYFYCTVVTDTYERLRLSTTWFRPCYRVLSGIMRLKGLASWKQSLIGGNSLAHLSHRPSCGWSSSAYSWGARVTMIEVARRQLGKCNNPPAALYRPMRMTIPTSSLLSDMMQKTSIYEMTSIMWLSCYRPGNDGTGTCAVQLNDGCLFLVQVITYRVARVEALITRL